MSVLDLKNIHKFLNSGALLALQGHSVFSNEDDLIKDPWIIAWDESKTSQNQTSKANFYLSEFTEEKGKWCRFNHSIILSKWEFKKLIIQYIEQYKEEAKKQEKVYDFSKLNSFRDLPRTWKDPEFQEFENYFNRFKEQIYSIGLKKIVPVVFATSEGTFGSLERARCLLHLADLDEGLYAYGYWNKLEGFLGASPELLFRKEKDQISTMALAGTGPINGTPLLNDKKELYEHQLVIDDLQTKLADCKLEWEETYEWKVGPLKHLKTLAHGLTQKNHSELLNLLHPTAALGVVPSHFGLKKVAEFCNPELRKYFGAPFGVQLEDSNKTELFIVALRNIQWDIHNTYLGSGCGLVKDSQIEKEWNELSLKRSFTKRFLNL